MARKSEKMYKVLFINNKANEDRFKIGAKGQKKMLPEDLYKRCKKLGAVELLKDEEPTKRKLVKTYTVEFLKDTKTGNKGQRKHISKELYDKYNKDKSIKDFDVVADAKKLAAKREAKLNGQSSEPKPLAKMNKTELLAVAKEKEVEATEENTKAEIIELINNSEDNN